VKKILRFIQVLFIGQVHYHPTNKLRPAIWHQFLHLKGVWTNKHYTDFGLERLIRLFLAVSLFLYPGLYIKSFFGRYGLIVRKIAVEFYVVFKLFLPIIFFELHVTHYIWAPVISGYLLTETIVYLAALIYLSNEFARPISYRRSLTALFINYIEICLDFAVIYSYCNYNIPGFFKQKLVNGMQVVYFSFSTSATVGYGDITPVHQFGQYLVIAQIMIFLVFVGLFINFFAAKVQDPTYNDSEQNYVKRKRKEVDEMER
jgi:hypothetical protein